MARGHETTTGRAAAKVRGAKEQDALPAAPAVAPAAGRGGKAGKRGEELRRALAIELHTLRLQAQDAVNQYSLRINGRIAEILAAVEGEAAAGEKARRLPAKAAAAVLAELRLVKVKPHKGRAKDLVRIQELVEALAFLLPPRE